VICKKGANNIVSYSYSKKIIILNRRISEFKFARLLLFRSINRLTDLRKMFISFHMKKNQYFYTTEGEILPLADSHSPVCRNTDSGWQRLRIVDAFKSQSLSLVKSFVFK
jgi:hypothetical protein